MNTEQQDKLWSDLSDESKQYVLKNYQDNNDTDDNTVLWIRREYESLFGSHNLNPEPQIKTWEDVVKNSKNIYDKDLNPNCGNALICCLKNETLRDKIKLKTDATIKIAKLIELGYGGMVSEEEWKDEDKYKFTIEPNCSDNNFHIFQTYHKDQYRFIAFHSELQAEEFMSYESNRKLVEQYYMM